MQVLKAIRGAINVTEDTEASIKQATIELIKAICEANSLKTPDLVSAHFTLTKDLQSFNPATAIRQELNWNDVCMICSQEAFIFGSLAKCLRVLIHAHVSVSQTIQHVYLKEAQVLRDDWCRSI